MLSPAVLKAAMLNLLNGQAGHQRNSCSCNSAVTGKAAVGILTSAEHTQFSKGQTGHQHQLCSCDSPVTRKAAFGIATAAEHSKCSQDQAGHQPHDALWQCCDQV